MSIIDIIAEQAWVILKEDPKITLIDIRTEEEWAQGIPCLTKDLTNKLLFISLNNLDQEILEKNVPDKKSPILFICRSGGRSTTACHQAYRYGYEKCYNIIDGFLGSNYGVGWKSSNLPWDYAYSE